MSYHTLRSVASSHREEWGERADQMHCDGYFYPQELENLAEDIEQAASGAIIILETIRLAALPLIADTQKRAEFEMLCVEAVADFKRRMEIE